MMWTSASLQLARECPARIIAEGHIHTPEQAVQALYAGAFALVVGGAITRPAEITARHPLPPSTTTNKQVRYE